MRAVAILILFWAGAALADQSGAFQDGKSLGSSANQGAFSGINSATAADKIPGYGTNPSETQFFQGGQGQLSEPGVAKMQNCATAAPDSDPINRQECEAVNFLARNPQIRPQFNITKNDPMFIRSKDLSKNAESIFQSLGLNGGSGSSTQCTTKTETTPAQYTTEICTVLKEIDQQQCTMGRIIDINTDANFRCDQTINAYETLKCRRSSSITCTGGGTGCAPSGIKTDSVSISGFGRFLVHPTTNGYWLVSAGTIAPDGSYINNSDFSGKFYNVYQSDIYFDITNKSSIATFFLNEILYDDNIAVWLNGHLIYHSTGGTDLSICTYKKYIYDDFIQEVRGVNDGVHACSESYFEGGGDIHNYGGVELKNYLIEGRNHVRIKVVIGKNGDAIIRFKTLSYCPTSCSVSTKNQCAALEERAK